MAGYTSFNDCVTDIELNAADAINAANNAYNSDTYKTSLNKIRTCLEVVCKAIIFYREANDAQAQITIRGNNLHNLINIIGSTNRWFDADAAKNENCKNNFHFVREKGNAGSHSGEVKHRICEEGKVEFRKILEWFYATFLSGRVVPVDIAAALNNDGLTHNIREKKAALFAYYAGLKQQYLQPVFHDENGMTLDKVYITPKVRFWEGCLHKRIRQGLEHLYRTTPFKIIEQVPLLHELVPYFLENRGRELTELQQPDARLFLLLGYPRQGKTSFCNWLLHHRIVPENLEGNGIFFVRLRDIADVRALFNNPLPALYEYVVRDIDLNVNYLEKNAFDRAVLVLDGLDELTMRENSGKDEIEEFCKKLIRDQEKYPQMRIILTSRYGYVDLDKFSRHEIIVGKLGRLDEEQQLSWLEKYRHFYPDCKLTAEKIKSINNERNKQYKHLRELIDQPILLHLVALADMDIDDNATRAGIYTKLFDHLIQRAWDKRQQIDALRELKDPQDLRTYIREIAFAIYQSEYEYVRKADLEKLPATEQFMECLGKTDVTAALKYVMIAFYMQDVRKKETDIDETDKRHYAVEFLHKSLQEYLVAEKIWEDLKSFAEQKRNKKWEFETADQALELAWRLFTPNLISLEIQDYLKEHIQVDTETDKNLVFERMMKFVPDLLEKHFLYSILPKEPMRAGLYAFRAYWVVLHALVNGQKPVLEEEKAKECFIELLKFMTTNSYVIPQPWDLSGANLSDANLIGANLIGANLSDTNLSDGRLSNANLRNANLNDAKLSDANLSDANLSNADLSGANLSGVKLSGANLSGANLSGVKLSGANLSGVKLSNADLSRADLSGVNLSGVNLSGVDLSNSDLSKADLSSAKLSRTDLSNAKLSNAKLSGAALSGADLSRADLEDTRIIFESIKRAKSLYLATGIPKELVTKLKTDGYGRLFEVTKRRVIRKFPPST